MQTFDPTPADDPDMAEVQKGPDRHIPRLSAAFVRQLAARLNPARGVMSLSKINLIDPANPQYARLCDRYKIAALGRLSTLSVGMAMDILDRFIADGGIDPAQLDRARKTAAAEAQAINAFLDEIGAEECRRCGCRKGVPAAAFNPQHAETMLGVMGRWTNKAPLQKAAHHALKILLKDAPQPHRP